jgi:hypothetical protein
VPSWGGCTGERIRVIPVLKKYLRNGSGENLAVSGSVMSPSCATSPSGGQEAVRCMVICFLARNFSFPYQVIRHYHDRGGNPGCDSASEVVRYYRKVQEQAGGQALSPPSTDIL